MKEIIRLWLRSVGHNRSQVPRSPGHKVGSETQRGKTQSRHCCRNRHSLIVRMDSRDLKTRWVKHGDNQHLIKILKHDEEVARLFYCLNATNRKEVYVCYLGVKKRFQHRGIGSKLLRKFATQVATRHPQIRFIQMWPVSKGSLRLCDRVFGKRYQFKGCERNLPEFTTFYRYGWVESYRHVRVWYCVK